MCGQLQRFARLPERHIQTDGNVGARSTETKTIGIGFGIGILSGRKRDPPNLMGKTQLQQTSVIGLMILPLQFPAKAEAAQQKDRMSIKEKRFIMVVLKRGVRTSGQKQTRRLSGRWIR